MDNRNTIIIYEDGSPQEYDVTTQRKLIFQKLKEAAQHIQMPAFHKGNIEPDFLKAEGYELSDSLKFVIEKQWYDTQGSGVFVSSNLADLIDWNNDYHKDDPNYYVVDLGKYIDGMYVVKSDNFSEQWSNMLASLTKNTIRCAQDESKSPEHIKTFAEQFYDHHPKFMNYLKIERDTFINWMEKEIDRIRTAIKTNNLVIHNISTSFQKECMGNEKGIYLGYTSDDDSITRGSVIFDIDKDAPYAINFKNHQDLAKEFFGYIYKDMLLSKMISISNESNIKALLYDYERVLPFEVDSKEGKEFLKECVKVYKQNEAIKNIKAYAKAHNIDISDPEAINKIVKCIKKDFKEHKTDLSRDDDSDR